MGYKLKKIYIHTPNTTHNLPSEYQEVEYIQLTGTQYISSFRFPVNFRFTIKAAFDTTTTYYNVYDTQSVSPMLWVDTSGRLEMNIDYKSSEFTKGTFITVVSDATGANNIVTIDGTQVISGTKVSTITQYTFLLHRGASDGFKGKISYMLLEDGNTKIFELIPCYRKLDDEIGLYDLVNDQFYTNSGTGTFTKGADILPTIEHQVRPNTRKPGNNTKIYLPLTDDYKDTISGTTLSTTGTVSLVTEGGVKCVRLNGGQLYGLSSAVITGNGARTLNFWFKYNSIDTSEWGSVVSWGSESNYSFTSLGDNGGVAYSFSGYGSSADLETGTSLSNGNWYNMAATYDGSTLALYLNGTQAGSKSASLTTGSSNLYIGGRPSGTCKVNGWINNVIVENRAWTADEISNYYDLTKSDYGL